MLEEIYFTENQFKNYKIQCKEVFASFNEILCIKNNVVNKELAYPLKNPEINNFQQAQQMYWYQFNAYIKKTQRVRAHAAKYWILLAVFFCMLLYEFFIKT